VGPTVPGNAKRKASEDGSESDEGFEDEPDIDRTPISHEIVLKDHTKVNLSLCIVS
jgi:hypothetical protein